VRRIECASRFPGKAEFRDIVFAQLIYNAQRQIDINEREVITTVENTKSKRSAMLFVEWTLYLDQLRRAVSRLTRWYKDDTITLDKLMRQIKCRVEFELQLASKPAPQRMANQKARLTRTDGSIMMQNNQAAACKLVLQGKIKAEFQALDMGTEGLEEEEEEEDNDEDVELEQAAAMVAETAPRQQSGSDECEYGAVEAPEEEEAPTKTSRFLMEDDKELDEKEVEALRAKTKPPQFKKPPKKSSKRVFDHIEPRSKETILEEEQRESKVRRFGIEVENEEMEAIESFEAELKKQQAAMKKAAMMKQ
jgi:hypothetical protein